MSRETLHHELLWKFESKLMLGNYEERAEQNVSRETLHHDIGIKKQCIGKQQVSRETLHHDLLWKFQSKQRSAGNEEHAEQKVSRETLHHDIGFKKKQKVS